MTVVPFQPRKPDASSQKEVLEAALEAAKKRVERQNRSMTSAAKLNALDVAQHLKAIREAQGISPEEFSELLGTPPSYLLSVESGASNPSVMLLAVMAGHLGYRVALDPLP